MYASKNQEAVPNIPQDDIQDQTLKDLQTTLVSASLSKNSLQQSDASQAIFECWFDGAKKYAKEQHDQSSQSNVHANMRRMTMEALVCLIGASIEKDVPFLCRRNLDAYAARSLLEHATQVLVLHSSKPKFRNLLITTKDGGTHSPSSGALLSWLQNVFCRELTRVVCYRNALDSTRSQALTTLKTAQELGESLMKEMHTNMQGRCPIQLDPQEFINLAVQSNIDISVRGTAGELITTICRCVANDNSSSSSSSNSNSNSNGGDERSRSNSRGGGGGKNNESSSNNNNNINNIRWQLTQVIAQRGMDDKAFTLGWRLGLLDNPKGVDILITRINAEAQRHKSSSSSESMSLTGNSRPLVSAVLRSIYEVSMNWRNEDVQDLGNEGKFRDASVATVQNRGDFTFDIQKHSESMASVLRACDIAAKSLYQERDSANSAEERSQEFLEALGALLETYPDSGALLHLILYPLTLEGLSTVAGLSYRFSNETWCQWLLPFIRKQLDNMSLRGISGRQLEQETVDLLRDCARHFYLNDAKDRQHRPSLAFGEQLYYCVIEAIRHGYIETEGFSRVAAVVIARHMHDSSDESNNSTSYNNEVGGKVGSNDKSNTSNASNASGDNGNNGGTASRHIKEVLNWVRYTLSDHVCHSIKTVRAIHEIFLTLLGLESSSGIGFDFDHSGGYGGPSSRSRSEQETLVLSVTTCGSTQDAIASLALWSELCTSYPVFVEQHELVVTQLLLTIRDDLDAAVRRRGCSVDWWAAAMRMLCVLPPCITPFNAPLLFDQVLKIMALCPAGERGSLAANCGDSTVASIVDQIQIPGTNASVVHNSTATRTNSSSKEQDVEVAIEMTTSIPPISLPAVLECTRRAGVLTRQALSRIVPEMLLLDQDPRVRVRALQAMQNRSDNVILQASGAIFGACTKAKGKNIKKEHDGSHNINMHDIELALASAPLIGKLAVVDKTGACVVLAVERLVWAARVTKEGSHMGQVDPLVLEALSMIPSGLESGQLVRFCTSKEGHKWLGRLSNLSGAWERAIESLVNEGKLLISSGRSGQKRQDRGTKEAERMYGPDVDAHRFEVPQGQFAEALPVCTIINVEEGNNAMDAMDAMDNKSSLVTENKIVNGIIVEQSSENDRKVRRQRSDSDFVHLSSDPTRLRQKLELEAQAVPAGKVGALAWADLNSARQEGRWDWTRSNNLPVANGVEVSSEGRTNGRGVSSPTDAFDFGVLPSAPTHVPKSNERSTTPTPVHA